MLRVSTGIRNGSLSRHSLQTSPGSGGEVPRDCRDARHRVPTGIRNRSLARHSLQPSPDSGGELPRDCRDAMLRVPTGIRNRSLSRYSLQPSPCEDENSFRKRLSSLSTRHSPCPPCLRVDSLFYVSNKNLISTRFTPSRKKGTPGRAPGAQKKLL
jgi:hypothetical protein